MFDNLKKNLINFLKDESKKIGLNKVILGLSGGIDSAIVAVLAKEVFKDNLLVIMMPSKFSSESSMNDAKELCKKFDINYQIKSIQPMLDGYFQDDFSQKLRVGNFSARMRMATLYDIAQKKNGLVLGTSNKSEILLGYGTIFGDTACAINPIGNIYKTDIFKFAKYLDIPNSILIKKPSADLWEGQSDEDELGFSYAEIDSVLIEFIDNKKTKDELLKLFNNDLVKMIIDRYYKNRFKSELPKIAII